MLHSWWFIYIRRLSLLERVWGGRRDRGGKNVLASALVNARDGSSTGND